MERKSEAWKLQGVIELAAQLNTELIEIQECLKRSNITEDMWKDVLQGRAILKVEHIKESQNNLGSLLRAVQETFDYTHDESEAVSYVLKTGASLSDIQRVFELYHYNHDKSITDKRELISLLLREIKKDGLKD